MVLDCPTQTLQNTRGIVLETTRLTLRQPTLADVKAIAGIVGDKRVSINLRRVPHPYRSTTRLTSSLQARIRNAIPFFSLKAPARLLDLLD